MRDLVLLAICVAGALYALRRPWVGAVMSVWFSVMSPHKTFGWSAAEWPLASLVAVATLIGVLFSRDKRNPVLGPPVAALLCLWIWICITLPFSLYFDASLELWERSMKIFLMVFVVLMVVDDRRKLDVLIAVLVFSLAYFGVKGGVFTIATGGNYRVWGPGGFVEGNNELALALVTILPIVRYLQMQATNKMLKHVGTATLLLMPATILGSHSRGALLALGAMGLFLWFKSERKAFGGIVIVAVGAAALALMSEQWWSRMDTIAEYKQDESAMGRINAWWVAWNIAMDRITGGGFMMYRPDVMAKYAPDPTQNRAAHSIYFQVMGEQGFIGLALFLSIGVLTWLTCRKLIKIGRATPGDKWAADLGAMVQVSMVGFGVGGAFLSLAWYDLPYYLMAIAVLALDVVRRQQTQAAPVTTAGAQLERRLPDRQLPGRAVLK